MERDKEVSWDELDEESFIVISEDDFRYEVEALDEDYIVPIPDVSKIELDSIERINQNILGDEFE